jgi:hypothetical protein
MRKEEGKQDYTLKYSSGYICMKPSEFKDLIEDYQELRARYERLRRWRK